MTWTDFWWKFINSLARTTWAWGTYFLVGYLCGVLLSEHVSEVIALTHWGNAWTYFWVVFWPAGLVWVVVVWLWFAVGKALLMVLLFILLIVSIAVATGCAFSWWKGRKKDG